MELNKQRGGMNWFQTKKALLKKQSLQKKLSYADRITKQI